MTYPAGDDKQAHQRVGRYEIFDRIASGGMATVHLARLSGAEGFSRVVAVKRMHPHFLVDPAFKAMFIAEARVAARVRHPNVVPILDVLAERDEIVIIMDYVHGESVMALARAARKVDAGLPIDVATSIMVGLLQGLHAAHTALDEKGKPLGLVHRDVSPHNVLVGTDGVARVLDFGIAKVLQGHGDTDPGVLKGKFSYIAPELIGGGPPSRQSDLFSASVVFWELLTGGKLFQGVNEQERLMRVVEGNYPAPRSIAPHIPERLDRIVMRGLALEPTARHASALDMAIELEQAVPLATQRVVGEWVSKLAGDVLAQRSELIHQIESTTISLVRRSAPPASTGTPAFAVPPLPSLAPSTILSATPPGVEPPPPVTSEVRAAHPKTLRIGLIAAGAAVVAVVALAALFALRSPAPAGAPTARAATTAAGAHDGPRAAAPNGAVTLAAPNVTAPSVPPTSTAAPAPTSVATTIPSTAPATTAPSPAEANRHPPVTRSGSATSSKSATHAPLKRPGAYLPNEL